MHYQSWIRVFAAACVLFASQWIVPAWADDAVQCKKLYLENQYKKAFPVCSSAAQQRWNTDAQFYLARMYTLGRGVASNDKEAIKWYRKAAQLGHLTSQIYLGVIYFNGFGAKKDNKKAAWWFLKAANQGDVYSQFQMGQAYFLGKGVTQDYKEAARWFLEAANQGDAKSQFNLGVMYATGHGVMQSGAAAADWYYKAGLSYLKEKKRDRALTCAGRIKQLGNIPNAFLANKLLARIYGGEGTAQAAPKAKKKKAASVVSGTGWPVVGGYVVTNHHVVAGHHHIVLVRRDGVKINVTVIADDTTNDLVLLKPASSNPDFS